MVYCDHAMNSGFFYSTRTLAGSQSLHSIVLSPSYEQDETLVVGNTNGWVYWPNDKGSFFHTQHSDALFTSAGLHTPKYATKVHPVS